MTEKASEGRAVQFNMALDIISKNDDERRIVAGYASLDVVDRQNERITNEAMQEALEKFMENPEFANTHVQHGNCTVGKVIPSYEDKEGVLWETKVDDTGTFIVSELRTDIKLANHTWDLIERGELKSYSVGGLALEEKELVCNQGSCHFVINKIELHEISYVDRPAVKGADFVVVKQKLLAKSKKCPCEAENAPKVDDSKAKVNKEEIHNSPVIDMADVQEPEISVEKDTEEQVTEEVTSPEEVIEATEKQDPNPDYLELKAMLEVLTNKVEQLLPAPETKSDATQYEPEKVDALKSQYGDEKASSLINLLGDEAFSLITVKEEEAATPTPQAEVKADETPDPKELLEKIETLETTISEQVETQVEKRLVELTPVTKRTPKPITSEPKPKQLSLYELSQTKWDRIPELAQRGA